MITNKKINFILLVTLILTFISCTQVVPEVKQAKSTVIFGYQDSESLPEARLAVYVQSETNVNRYETMKLYSNEPKFVWETNDLSRLSVSKKSYVGYTNFVVPDNMKIPSGAYSVLYINADEKDANISVSVNYDEKLYTMKSSEIESYMNEKKGEKRVALYDSDGVLIHYGDYKFNNLEEIKRKYKNADTYKIIWNNSNKTVMCILPSEKL